MSDNLYIVADNIQKKMMQEGKEKGFGDSAYAYACGGLQGRIGTLLYYIKHNHGEEALQAALAEIK